MFAKELLNNFVVVKWLKESIHTGPEKVKVIAAEVVVHCLALS